jgi:hypothetical protein
LRRILAVVIAAAGLGAAAPTEALGRGVQFSGPGVKFTLQGRVLSRFQIKMDYVCGPTGGQKVSEVLKVSGLGLSPAGKFTWHFEQGPLMIDLRGKISGRTARGSASGFGDVGAGSSDCGTGTVGWTAARR